MPTPAHFVRGNPQPLFSYTIIFICMKNLSKSLERLYNVLGNNYLTDNFDTGPFDFKVNIRKAKDDNDLQNYIVEIYSVPELPEAFWRKSDKKNGIHISALKNKFKEYIGYVDSSFGGFGKTIGIKFMNVK